MNKVVSRISSSRSDLLGCGLLVALFAATRLALILLGMRPDIKHFYGHWQYLDLHLLKTDYLQSITLLHSQPPLWNALLGALLNASGGSEQEFLLAYSSFSFLVSLSTALLIFFTLVRLRAARALALMASSVYIVASSAYFYEAYVFYPLFTAFLAICFFSTLAYSFSSSRQVVRFAFSILSCICLILLSMTWSLFHPAFVLITSWAVLWRAFVAGETEADKLRPFRSWTALFASWILLSLIATSVPIKNKILFNYFGSGSWLGMNLAQVAPAALKGCEFGPLNGFEIKSSRNLTGFTESSDHPAIRSLAKTAGGDINYNHTGYIVRSESCKSKASKLIAENFFSFAKGRIRQLFFANTRLSDSYNLYPKGMESGSPARLLADARNILYVPFTRSGDHRRHLAPLLIPIGLFGGASLLVFSPAVRVALPAGSIESLTGGLWLMIWLYAVGYFFNGAEQERMRFTIEPLFVAWLSLICHYCFLVIVRSKAASGAGKYGRPK